jgi:uncharacterized membrane protein
MNASNLGIIGIFFTVISAVIYLIYPTPTMPETLTLTAMWFSAIFGGAIVGMSVKEKEIEKLLYSIRNREL